MLEIIPEGLYNNFRLFELIGGEHTKIQSITQAAFTKKLLPTTDQKVYGVVECSSSLV